MDKCWISVSHSLFSSGNDIAVLICVHRWSMWTRHYRALSRWFVVLHSCQLPSHRRVVLTTYVTSQSFLFVISATKQYNLVPAYHRDHNSNIWSSLACCPHGWVVFALTAGSVAYKRKWVPTLKAHSCERAIVTVDQFTFKAVDV